MKKKLFTLFVFMSFAVLTFAQNNIKGIVKDKTTGEPLPGANIKVAGLLKGASTNANGKFEVKNTQTEIEKIEVSFVGYETQTLELASLDKSNIEVMLAPKAILQEDFIIKATNSSELSPTTFKNINKAELESKNLGQDLPFLINNTPSLVVTSDAGAGVGYTGVRIRGSDLTRINVTINGVPVNDAESQGVFFVNMPDFASSVQNVQIQRGVGTSTNGGSAFGATINFETNKLNAKPYIEYNTANGSFNTFKNSIQMGTGLLNDHFAFDVRLSKLNSDGYIDRATSDLKSFYISAGYYGKKNMLKFIAFSGKEKTYQAWGGVPKDSLKTNRTYNEFTYENQTDNYQQDNYQLHFSQEFFKKSNFNLALHYTKGRGYYEEYKEKAELKKYNLAPIIIGDTIEELNLIRQKWMDNDFYGVVGSVNYNEIKNLKVIVGGGYNEYDGNHFGKVIWSEFFIPMNYKWYDNNSIKKDANVYAKAYYTLIEKLTIFGDLQYRNIDYKISGVYKSLDTLDINDNLGFINPKFGGQYILNDNIELYASYSIANKEPNRDDYADNPKISRPKHETLNNFEMGVKQSYNNLLVNLNFFRMDYKNQLVSTGRINDVGEVIKMNVDKSYRMGIELDASWAIHKMIIWNVNTAFSENKIIDFVEYYDNWEGAEQKINNYPKTDISFSPSLVASSEIIVKPIKNLNVMFNTKYVGKQYLDNTSNKEKMLNEYLVNDVRISYTFRNIAKMKEISFNCMINNIFNEEYESNGWSYTYFNEGKDNYSTAYYPQAGTNFLVGLTLKF